MRAYLNGQYMPLSEAKVSPLDRGYLYADGVYEVIPVYSRVLFRYQEHMDRLQNSLDGIGLKNPYSAKEWKEIISRLVSESAFEHQALYLQVTRGADKKRDPAFPIVEPGIFLFTAEMRPPSADNRENGVGVIVIPDIRWAKCNLKTISLLPNVMARQQSAEVGCVESLMIKEGCLTEGSASNAFIVKNGVVITPPANEKILPGITRGLILELIEKHKVPCEVRPVSEAELREADEVWISSSTKELLPVTKLDGKPVGNGDQAGKVGPMARLLYEKYQDYKAEYLKAQHG